MDNKNGEDTLVCVRVRVPCRTPHIFTFTGKWGGRGVTSFFFFYHRKMMISSDTLGKCSVFFVFF